MKITPLVYLSEMPIDIVVCCYPLDKYRGYGSAARKKKGGGGIKCRFGIGDRLGNGNGDGNPGKEKR